MKRHKKSKLITYFFSFLPGAGFMYRGYMKRGFSYLTLFLLTMSLANRLDLEGLLMIPALIWFYAFFDQINTLSSTEEEQLQVKDEIILKSWINRIDRNFFKKNHQIVGGGFLIMGGYLLMSAIYESVLPLMPVRIQPVLHTMMSSTPKLLISCIVMYCGMLFVQGNVQLGSIFKKQGDRLTKEDENLLAQTNVVYYMNKGEERNDGKEKKERPEGGREFSEILDDVSREQLLKRAKQLLEDDIYQSIHIESAAAVEPVKVEPSQHMEKAGAIEKAPDLEKVEVEKCPHEF